MTPKSVRDEVTGWRGSELCVRVTAAPEGGKANAAVEKVLAQRLGVARSAVSVVRGHAARIKTMEVQGLDTERIAEILGANPTLW